MTNKKLNKFLINTFSVLLILSSIVCLLSVGLSAQTNPKENSLTEKSETSIEDENILKELALIYCELAIRKKHSDLEKVVASELDYKRESDLIRDEEKKSLERKFSHSSKNKEIEITEKLNHKVSDFDLTPLLLLKRDFILNEFPNSIYELRMNITKTKLILIKNNEATVRVTFAHDLTVTNCDFHFIKNAEKKWKIYYIKYVKDTNRKNQNPSTSKPT